MKKLLLLALIILIQPQTYAFEDYLIISDYPVSSIFWDDDSILDAAPIFTIDNKKNTIIVKVKKEGETNITVETENGNKTINAVIKPDETFLSETEGFTFFPLDVMEEK